MMKSIQIGLKVQALRKTKKMTQEDLASMTGVSWRTISNLETGRTVPKLELIYNIAQIFQISIDELLMGKTQTNKPFSRLKLENQIIADLQSLNDNMLYHLKEYILLLKKDFERAGTEIKTIKISVKFNKTAKKNI